MTAPRRLASPEDCLIAIPELLGYEPAESLVIVPLADRRGRALLRVDLPSPDDDHAEFAFALLHHIIGLRDCTRLLVAVFTDEHVIDGPLPASAVVAHFCDAANAAGIEVVDALCRGRESWEQYFGPDHGSRATLDRAATTVPAGSFIEFAEIPDASDRQRRHFARLLRNVGVALLPSDDEALAAWQALRDYAEEREPDDLPDLPLDDARVTVAVALRSLRLTELLLADAAFGIDVAVDLSLVWDALLDDLDAAGVDGVVSDRAEFEPIDLDRTASAIRAIRALVGVMPDAERANALAALSWLEWVRGGASLADHHSRAALRHDPDQLLAGVVNWLVSSGVSPGWFGAVGCEGGFREYDFAELLRDECA